MRRIATVLLTLLVLFPLFGQSKEGEGINFQQLTLSEALAKAKSDKNSPDLVFIDCYTDWCGPCKQMERNVFPLAHVGELFNANFINLKIDMEKGEGPEVGDKYGVRAYPTFLILDSEGNEINRIIGGASPEVFIEKVKSAMDGSNNPKLLKERYLERGNSADAAAYLAALQSSYMTKDIVQFLMEEFDALGGRKYSHQLIPFIETALLYEPSIEFITLLLNDLHTAASVGAAERATATLLKSLKSLSVTYLADKLEMLKMSREELVPLLDYIGVIARDDATASYFVKALAHYEKGELDEISKLLNVRNLMALNEDDRAEVERLLTNVNGIPRESIKAYRLDKINYYKSQIENLERFN